MTMPEQKPRRSKQDFATPADFIQAAKRRLGIEAFAFDFAADSSNHKAPAWWSESHDALSKTPQQWAEVCRGGWGWLNPPFTTIGPWAARCVESMTWGANIAFLVPAAVGSNWFRDYVHGHALVLGLNGRLCFMVDRPTWGYPKDCILCLFTLDQPPGFEVWNWRAK